MSLLITGTFLDEISHDIPHQNWGEKEWDNDFAAMKQAGINTVIMIRCGYKRWATFNSRVLKQQHNIYSPPIDLVDLFLSKAEKYGFNFFFGVYDSGNFWETGKYGNEVETNLLLIDEVWQKYGHRNAFKGWYLSQEVSRKNKEIVNVLSQLGKKCKTISNNLPVLISPFIDGSKALYSYESKLKKEENVSLEQHKKEWDDILSGIKGAVDILAFQDGQLEYDELPTFMKANKKLADKHGFESWTNCESFDRDMPIKFLPIKWEKLLLKLKAGEEAGIKNAITFEFSHFMSPNSSYPQAHHLYNRYKEYYEENQKSEVLSPKQSTAY